ncbi:MAG: hydantoinase/oxoprolinase family protein, partial [Selenomonadaceae bacterium]|nr:hydantoinase/oxoprolinase family protein [Selenomonadaceae bacterium]
ERLSDGIFLEAGGTSTDISVVKDGRVMVRYGEIGGHKTYLSSLDVRTLGVAGGSMIRVENGKITDVGPRSAHIAGLPYEVFSDKSENPKLELIAPLKDDEPAFAVVSGEGGRKVSLTLAGAANLLRSVPEGDYAYAKDTENARVAWQALGDAIGVSAEEAAKQAMDIASEKIWEIVSRLIEEYKLSPELLCLAGGGGSGGVVVPYLGKMKNVQWKIVKNAPIISTIGVAMAMVREVVERTVVNPTESDMKSIRHEALQQIMKSGAKEATVEIAIEYDKKTNILRATATGATELKKDGVSAGAVSEDELKAIAAKSMRLPVEEVTEAAATGKWHIYEGMVKTKFWGIFPSKKCFVRVIDRNGVVTLQREGLGAVVTNKSKLKADIDTLFEETAAYGTVGEELPPIYAYYGEKQLDLSGLTAREQIISVLEAEFDILPDDEKIILLAVR